MIKLFAFILSLTIISTQALAFPLPTREQAELARQLQFTPANILSAYDFEGIVALSNCSGSLVRFETSRETDFAMILTNGHCLQGGFLKPGQVIYNVPAKRSFQLFHSNLENAGNLTSSHILYATMTGTDMALYKLNESYADIYARTKVRPLVIDSNRATKSSPIEVISGYWKKGYSCNIERFIYMLEEAGWLFTDSIRYSRPGCETIGGTSGSPIVNSITRKVIGVNNTGNESGQSCTMNNPCEVDENGNKTVHRGVSYGQQVYWVYSCLTENNEIDLSQTGCLLPQ